MSGPLVALFAVQGEGTEEEQRRKEQMKKTGRELQAQREENERRVMKEKHRGGERRQARTPKYYWWAVLCTSRSLCHCPSLPPHTHTHAITPTHSPSPHVALMDGHLSQTGVMMHARDVSPKSIGAQWIIQVLKAWKKEKRVEISIMRVPMFPILYRYFSLECQQMKISAAHFGYILSLVIV